MSKIEESFAGALHIFAGNVAVMEEATFFTIRPINHGRRYTCTSQIFGADTNRIEIRFGRPDAPSALLAVYDGAALAAACTAFFELKRFGKPQWYDGVEIFLDVSDLDNMLVRIIEHFYDPDDTAFLDDLFRTAGLDRARADRVMAAISG